MITAELIIGRIVDWATAEPPIERLLLVGSRTRAEPPDDLADFDVQIYSRTTELYTCDDTWLRKIALPWVCVHDEYAEGDVKVPTRLAIFDGGVKVDFAFYPAGVTSAGVRAGLPHRTLLEKRAAARLETPLAPAQVSGEVPTEAEFRRLVDEFWFEAYHVAKYLVRNELWLAKSRDWGTKQLLLRMIDWHERTSRGNGCDIQFEGHRDAFSQDTWQSLYGTFSGFSRDETWRATVATIRLFQRLAADVGHHAGECRA